jgi:glycosyltransferase involved in cell wall biosynthesis
MTAREDSSVAPTLGVFLANYNHAKYLPDALDALLSQSVQATSITVVDDASSDNSVAIIQDYARRHAQIDFVLNRQNKGYVQNANEWLARSTRDLVYFAAADDCTLPHFFERSTEQLRQNPSAGLCSALCYILDEGAKDCVLAASPRPMESAGYLSPQAAARSLHRDGSWLWGTATVYRRETLQRYGGFATELHGYTDAYVSTVIALREGSCFIPEPLAIWRRFLRHSISAVTLLDLSRSTETLNAIMLRLTRDLGDILPPGYPARFARRWLYDVLQRQFDNSEDLDPASLSAVLSAYAPALAKLVPLIGALPISWRHAALALLLRPQDILPSLKRRRLTRAIVMPAPGAAA